MSAVINIQSAPDGRTRNVRVRWFMKNSQFHAGIRVAGNQLRARGIRGSILQSVAETIDARDSRPS